MFRESLQCKILQKDPEKLLTGKAEYGILPIWLIT